jgi:hypothetical protein
VAAPSRVGIALDEALGRKLAAILRGLNAPGAPEIQDVRDLGLSGASDEVVLRALSAKGFVALVTRDSSMLSASVRRDVWRSSGISVFMGDGKWGNLKLFEQARLLICWWPTIAAQADSGPQGGAWRMPADAKASGLQRVFAGSTEEPTNSN